MATKNKPKMKLSDVSVKDSRITNEICPTHRKISRY